MKRLSGVNLHQLQNDFASQSVEFAEIALCLILSAEVRGTAHAAYKKLVAWRKHEWEILENLALIYFPRLREFYVRPSIRDSLHANHRTSLCILIASFTQHPAHNLH